MCREKNDTVARMKGLQSTGMCALCGESGISKRSIERHLVMCLKHVQKTSDEKFFHLFVTDPYNSRYWLHIEAVESATVQTLDWFLREIWVECCGHLSQFSIGGPTRKLKDVLAQRRKFSYEYDFGTTTDLSLEVIARGAPVSFGKNAVRLLARNDALDIPCYICEKTATVVCLDCQQELRGPHDELRMFFCEMCINARSKHSHHDDEEMRLPVVNSPRMGVCGYTGEK